VGRFSQGLSVRDGRRLLLRSSDELRKGAALTQVQIAELVLCEPDVTVRSPRGRADAVSGRSHGSGRRIDTTRNRG
jgi:hypothetical protein